ncbi:hypothetical protein [Wolbachia endosymbiont of Folsomia candida]|uniref:hypothetical protein n=1 Tax=Wolbachia endosymbiont of Folsomia candida TaxID=169402 RepID=UPI000A8ABF77|nr:hypothetical protein [Wolbachia endosymbiont of Folsomia candida]APR98091.1 hypothetical protein ASM33_02120 [Wolbachia endosymbiont of Folsomia candida]
MDKVRVKKLVLSLGIGIVVGTFSWYLINFTSPCTVASAITGGTIGTLMTMLIMSHITENTTNSEQDWFVLSGMGVTILAFGTAVILNQIANSLFPNAILSGWQGALTCAVVGAITMMVAQYIEHLVEETILPFHPEKEQQSSLSEVRVEAVNISPVKK